MKIFYVNGTAIECDFEERFEKTVMAENIKDVENKLYKVLNILNVPENSITIDEIYETSFDAMV